MGEHATHISHGGCLARVVSVRPVGSDGENYLWGLVMSEGLFRPVGEGRVIAFGPTSLLAKAEGSESAPGPVDQRGEPRTD